MYLQIKKARLVPWDYKKVGSNIIVSMVWLYDSDGRCTRFVKLNDVVLEILKNVKIEITEDGQLAQTPVLFSNTYPCQTSKTSTDDLK